MEKIRVEKENVYQIEVNDKGEYIEFDLLDIDLPMKLMNGAEELKKQKRIYKNKLIALNKQYKDNQRMLLFKQYDLDKEFCTKLRSVFDGFLGEGACQKIFGNVDRIGMFDAFFEQLSPHLDKLVINVEQIKNNLYEKYNPNKKEVI